MTSTNATPGELNAAGPAASRRPALETPVTAEQTLTLLAPSQRVTVSFGPLHVTASHGRKRHRLSLQRSGFEEAGLGEYKETGAGIISSISGYNGEGTKVIGPQAIASATHPP